MIQYLSMAFGINFKNKWIANFLISQTFSILFLIVLQIAILIHINYEIKTPNYKILTLITFASKIISFLAIKLKSSQIFRLYDKLVDYQNKSYIKYYNHYISSIIFISFTFLMTWTSTAIHFNDLNFMKLYKESAEKQETLPMKQKMQIILMSFYVNAWQCLVQFIFYEFNSRYVSILNEFNREIRRNVSKPDKNVIIFSQIAVSEFTEFRVNINKNVDFIKYFIFIDTFGKTVPIIVSMFFIPNFNCNLNYIIVTHLVLTVVSFLWTMSSALGARKARTELILELNHWKSRLSTEESTLIEIKFLEKTIEKLKSNKKIEVIDFV